MRPVLAGFLSLRVMIIMEAVRIGGSSPSTPVDPFLLQQTATLEPGGTEVEVPVAGFEHRHVTTAQLRTQVAE